MRELTLKRNKLKRDAMRLREIKFEDNIKSQHSIELNDVQNKMWHKLTFYDNLAKAYDKNKKIIK